MATKLADAYVQVIPSAEGIKGSLQKVLGGEAASAGTSAGTSIASKIKGAIAAAGIGTAVVAGVKAALNQGAELQQNLGGTEAVFGDFAQTIQDNATEAYKNMGMSASDYMATANKMGSLFQGSGLDQQRSLELTSSAMQRAADVASVMGIDASTAMESIAGAAKGNFTMMDNLGVAMNATTLEAYALEKGVNFKWNTASNAEKAELAMEMFFDRTSQYAGNYAKEADTTFSGSFESMAASAKNVLGNMALGKDIGPSLMSLGSATKTFLFNNLIPMLGNIVKSVPTIFSTGFTMAKNALTGIDWLGAGQTLIGKIKEGITALGTDVPQAIQDIGTNAITWFQDNVDWKATGTAVLNLLKSGITILTNDIPTAIKNIGLSAITLMKGVDWLGLGVTIINTIGDGIILLITSIPTALQNIGNTAKAWFEAIEWDKVGETVIGLLKAGIQKFVIDIPLAIMNIAWDAIKWFKSALWEVSGGDIIGFIINGIVKFVTSIPDKLKEIADSAIEYFKNATWFASGMAIITKIKNGIIQFVTNIPDKLKEIAGDAIEKFKNCTWVATGMAIITKIKNGIVDFVTKIPDKLIEIAKSGIEAIKNSSWLSTGHAIITRIIKGLKEFFSKIPEKLWEIIQSAITKITDIETWKQVGKDIINGIVDGIKAIPGALGGALKNAVGDAKDALLGFLDINSPSKVFRDEAGKPIGEGIVVGFNQGVAGLADDMVSSVNAAKKALTSDMDTSYTYTVSGRSAQLEAMPNLVAGAVIDGVQKIADGVERGIGSMKMVANNRETARFMSDLGFARS